MQINWFTVAAQIVNFVILVWLLKRFLYKPVLKAIDERENKIAAQIKDAEAKDASARLMQAEFIRKNKSFDDEKKSLMDKAAAETEAAKQKLFETARNDAALLRTKLENSLKEMQENLSRAVAQKTQLEVFAIAGKTLADLASTSLEEQSVKIFIQRLFNMTSEQKKQFIAAFQTGSDSILIQSAYELPDKQKTDIKNSVTEVIGRETQFQFKTAPEIICGIELVADGYKLSWSISEHLNSLQKDFTEALLAAQ